MAWSTPIFGFCYRELSIVQTTFERLNDCPMQPCLFSEQTNSSFDREFYLTDLSYMWLSLRLRMCFLPALLVIESYSRRICVIILHLFTILNV